MDNNPPGGTRPIERPDLQAHRAEIAAFCRRHHIRRLSVFGSVLRDDFGPDSDKDDLVYIRHMLDTAEKAARKVEGIARADFDRDENLQLAIVYLIQTLGESARRVSATFRDAHPEIPWAAIVGYPDFSWRESQRPTSEPKSPSNCCKTSGLGSGSLR
jgi:predicted nucleotidyltransferase